MSKRNVLAVLLGLACMAPASFGQTNEELQKQFQELKAEVAQLRGENAELRNSSSDNALEEHINALADRYTAAGSVATGADSTTLSGEIRTRWNAGFGDTAGGGERDGTWTTARARLGFEHKFSDHVAGFVELQGLFTYGSGSQQGQTPVELYQAWIHVGNIFGREELSSKTGRQEFVKGNQLHFGNSDWYNGTVMDGTRWDWAQKDSFHLTAFAFKLSTSDADFNQFTTLGTSHDDDEMYGLYFTFMPFNDKAISVDIYWFYNNGHGGASASGSATGSLGNTLGAGSTSYFHTFGARLGGAEVDLGDVNLDFSLEFAYQTGDANGPSVDIEGWVIEAEVGATFGNESPVRVFVRFLYATGPDNDSGYIPLYPNRHSNDGFRARYGHFDILPMTNVVSIGGGASFDPAKDWTLGVHFIWSTLDEGSGDYGWEIDLFGEYRYSNNLVFNGGVAILDPDDALVGALAVDNDTQFLFWLQARLTF